MSTIRTLIQLVPALVASLTLSFASGCVAAPDSADDAGDDVVSDAAEGEVAEAAQAATLDDPDYICVTAHESTNSGTGNSIDVGYIYMGSLFQCTIPGGVGTGASACCAPTSKTGSFSKAGVTMLGFTVGYTSSSADTDGLRVTEMSAKQGSSTYSAGSFTSLAVSSSVCEGCKVGTFCNSCWIDSDAHGKCSELVISGTTPYVPGSNWVYCN